MSHTPGCICVECEDHLREAAPELLRSCKWFIDQLERGIIVRDITKDSQPDWANRMMHFTLDLQRVLMAIRKAEGK